jgi:anti-sigma factor RsiW
MAMTCEEFATAGLDLGAANGDPLLQKAAREHLRECPHCAVLHENWQALREDLRILGAETAEAETPTRVEMRLRQEFRTKHKTIKRQRAALVLGWSLATATALFFVFTWVNWHLHRGGSEIATNGNVVSTSAPTNNTQPAPKSNAATDAASGNVLMASNGGDFTLLPDSMPPAPEDATVVHVQMQRGALEALGFTVNEEHAGDWIKVDLLVGDDGLPQAVRFPQATSTSGK